MFIKNSPDKPVPGDYQELYASISEAWRLKGWALTRTWHCECGRWTRIDIVDIVIRAIEPPCEACGKPLPWRQTFDA